MQIAVNWSPEVIAKFPELAICIGAIRGIHVEKNNEQLRKLKTEAYEEVRAKYDVEKLKEDPTVRAYRDFYWKLDIDPTKTRPSGEALLRRAVHGNELPNINTAVDAYNLASMKTIIPISGFDKDKLNPPIQIRFAKNDETFTGIGMNKPTTLTDRILVVSDEKQIVSIYPYRDSDHTKISEQTQNALVIGYGAPKITENQLKQTIESTALYIKQVAGGEIQSIEIFKA